MVQKSVADTTVCVVGLGYVGLPLACAFGRSPLTTYGFDVNSRRIAALKAGRDETGELSEEEVGGSGVNFSDEATVLQKADFLIVAVPTPVDKAGQPDLTLIRKASETVGRNLQKGAVVVYESTVYPGVTEDVCLPILEKESGLTCGIDFKIGYSPERINPGDKEHTLERIVKVVSGMDEESLDYIASVYAVVCKAGVHRASSIKVAEAAKVIENTQRDLNIALVNELALIFHRLDISTHDVLEAAGTKWNFLRFKPGLVGGHCFSGNQRLTLINGHHHKVRTLSGYWEELTSSRPGKIEQAGSVTLFYPKETIKTLSFDYEKGEAVFTPISCFSLRQKSPGVRFVTGGNHVIEVTDRHPMIVDEDGTWFVKLAKDVEVGDRLPLLQDLPLRPELRQSVDLIAEIPEAWHGRYRVKRVQGTWRELKDQLQIKKHTGQKASNFYNLDYLPLSVFLQLEAAGVMPVARSEVRLVSGRGAGSFQSFPAVVPLTAEFARLVGYYLTEGCSTPDKGAHVHFTFFSEERETIADCLELLRKLGIGRVSQYQDKQWQSYHIKASSELFGFLLEKVLKCGLGSEDAAIPEELLYASDVVRWQLLTGLLRGDGGVKWSNRLREYQKNSQEYAHANNVAEVTFFSSSPRLFHDTQLLFMSLHIPFTLDTKRPLLSVHGSESLRQLAEVFLDSKREKLWQYLAHKQRKAASKVFKSYKGYTTVAVATRTSVELAESYSLETAPTHTVVTDSGIITHNCIGVDPFYLVHKAREVGYHPDVITAGRRVNDYMPEFVAYETIKALTKNGKPVAGAKVLVMGLTFKEDVTDVRNSKIAVTIDQLKEFGVEVVGYDPMLQAEEVQKEFGIELVDTLTGSFDAVIVGTVHKQFAGQEEQVLSLMQKPVLLDIKGAFRELATREQVDYWTL